MKLEKVPRRASTNEAQGDLDSRNSSDMTTCMIECMTTRVL